jgi:hypothetical protein
MDPARGSHEGLKKGSLKFDLNGNAPHRRLGPRADEGEEQQGPRELAPH